MTLVSCLVPAYNHEQYVGETVRSILADAAGEVEVVAVDDASSDGTYGVLTGLAQEFPELVVLRNERNLGATATVMRAFDASTSPFITGLASDDRWLPGRLRTQLDALESGGQWSYGRAHVIDTAGHRLTAEAQGPAPDADGMLRTLLRGQAIYAPTLMYRRDLLERVGGLQEGLWEDLAATLRFACVAEPGFHTEALVEYRLHDANVHSGIVDRGLHFRAHAEAVRSLSRWTELPSAYRPAVADHLAVWEVLERYAAGDRVLRGLWRADRQVVDGVMRRQAPDLVRDLAPDQVLRLELTLQLRGARDGARAIADLRGGPVGRRALRKARRYATSGIRDSTRWK